MKKIIVVALIIFFISPSLFAAENITIPPYAKDISKSCGCDCHDRLAFQQIAINNDSLVRWAQEAILMTFNYGFGNYQAALKDAAYYFTPVGWENFGAALRYSGNLQQMLDNKLIMSAELVGLPKIISKPSHSKIPYWQINLPVKIAYFNAQMKHSEVWNVTLLVTKLPDVEGVRALGIEQVTMEGEMEHSTRKSDDGN